MGGGIKKTKPAVVQLLQHRRMSTDKYGSQCSRYADTPAIVCLCGPKNKPSLAQTAEAARQTDPVNSNRSHLGVEKLSGRILLFVVQASISTFSAVYTDRYQGLCIELRQMGAISLWSDAIAPSPGNVFFVREPLT